MNAVPRSRLWTRRLSALAGAAVLATLVGMCFREVWFPRAAITHDAIDVEGLQREYRLVTPRSVRGRTNVPVVFALHGANDTTDEMAAHAGLDELAVAQGFLLVYLQGRLLNWPPFIPPENPTLLEPDLAFFRAMCDLVVTRHHADPQRIYLVGVSQGGAMAGAITAKCSERIAATVVGCGWMPEPLDVEPLNTRHKCPLLFVVGSHDTRVPPDVVRVGLEAFEREGHPVEMWVIEGFGHGWPREENERVWAWLASNRQPESIAP